MEYEDLQSLVLTPSSDAIGGDTNARADVLAAFSEAHIIEIGTKK